MKQGFYLSPDGLHIIEIRKATDNTKFIFEVIGMSGPYIDFLFDIYQPEIDTIFSSWEYLGY